MTAMRLMIGAALLAAVSTAACKKTERSAVPTANTTGSGPGSAPVLGGLGSNMKTPGPAASVAPFDAKAALDAALKAKGIADKDIKKQATGPHSAWALVISKTRDDHYVMEYTVMRAAAEGVSELHIPAREGGDNPALDVDVGTFDVRDLDGDGHDECLTILAWQLDHTFPYAKGCKKCEYGEGENGEQLYVIADKAGALAVAFTHLVEYTTLSQPGSATDPDPPAEEKIAYDWKVEGTPPVVTLTRTDDTLDLKRQKQLLDPATDPLLAAGSGESVPLSLK